MVIKGKNIIFSTGVSKGRWFVAIFVAKSLSVTISTGLELF